MIAYISALVLLGIALIVIDLRKTYNFYPARELKRQARGGDKDAAVLYKAVAYGGSLRILLWMVLGICVSVSFVLLTQAAPAWLAGFIVAVVIWYAFAWAPNSRMYRASLGLAVAVTPLVAWLLSYLHRPFEWVAHHIERRRAAVHTGLFVRDDLIDFIESQKGMPGSRITNAELDIVLHALSFGEKTAASVMVPGRQVKTVNAADTLGPILMDELYESKYSRFPVIGEDTHTIVGTLYLRDLVAARAGGLVHELMKPHVYYVHETQSLYQVLHAFLTTKHQLLVVINSHEQYVGIVTIEDVLEQVIGHKIEDEFDAYEDRRAVADYPNRQRGSGEAQEVVIEADTIIETSGEIHKLRHSIGHDE